MEYRRIFDLFSYQLNRFPQGTALARKKSLHWERYSTHDCIEYINEISAALLNLGLEQDDKIAIMSPAGHPYWTLLEMGALQIGLIVLPVHASIKTSDLAYILRHASVKYCFVANHELFRLVREVQGEVKSLKKVITFRNLPDTESLDDLRIPPTARQLETIQTFKAGIHEDDLATIIYTSGTSGPPKGVMLSHKNIISNIKAVARLVPVSRGDTVLSFLPPSHVFEHTVIYAYLAVGANIYFARPRDPLLELLRELRPNYFTAVPLMVERFYEAIIERTLEGPNWREDLTKWGITLGKKYPGRNRMKPSYMLKLMIADILVFRHWRKILGGRIRGVVVGGAAMREDLSRLFCAAGIELREGYGLTETAPIIAFNRFEAKGQRFGTVGLPIPGVKVQIEPAGGDAGEGEILVKGPNVMLGYFREEEATRSVFTSEGWLRTGDLGVWVDDRFLRITGRKKVVFKSGSGKFIYPEKLEAQLRNNPYISQCMILGYNRPFLSALIHPNFELLKHWCVENSVHWTAPQFMVINPRVQEFYKTQLEEINQDLLPHEKIRSCQLLHTPWSIESGELTITLKLRRDHIREKYRKQIEEIYKKKV